MEPNPIQTILSLNLNGGMPFFKRSDIINSAPTCSMTTFFYLTRSLMAKYLMLICLLRLPLLLFLAIKIVDELSQYIFNGLEIGSTILSPDMKLFIHTPCDAASKQETNSAFIVEIIVKVCFALLQDISTVEHKQVS